MFVKGTFVIISAVLSTARLAAGTPMATRSPAVDIDTSVPLNHTANAAVWASLQARSAENGLGKRDDNWHLGIRSWTYTTCGPNGLNCQTEHTESNVAWGGCIGGPCDAELVQLAMDDKNPCDKDINICGKTVRLANSGDEFSCKPAKDIPRDRENLGYAFVEENGDIVGACAVNFDRFGENCIASAAYGFEGRFECTF